MISNTIIHRSLRRVLTIQPHRQRPPRRQALWRTFNHQRNQHCQKRWNRSRICRYSGMATLQRPVHYRWHQLQQQQQRLQVVILRKRHRPPYCMQQQSHSNESDVYMQICWCRELFNYLQFTHYMIHTHTQARMRAHTQQTHTQIVNTSEYIDILIITTNYIQLTVLKLRYEVKRVHLKHTYTSCLAGCPTLYLYDWKIQNA